MRPSERYMKALNLLRLTSGACGTDVFIENYKVNTITLCVIACIVLYFIFTVYTIQAKIAENWTVALEAFCMVGSVLQGISKLASAIFYAEKFRTLAYFLNSVYVEYEVKGSDYKLVLNKSVSRLSKIVKMVGGLYLLTVVTIVSVPLGAFIFTDRRLFVMQFFLPYVDPSTRTGYLLINGVQMTCLCFGAFGNFAGDIFMIILFTHTSMLVDIFELKIKELNSMSIGNDSSKTDKMLIDVIKWHQTYSSYIQDIDTIYFWVNFVEINTAALSIVLTLVISFTGDWPGAYTYIVLCFSMLYFYCGMGTIVEIANERVTDDIYDIHWYNLPVLQQKSVRLMLMNSQSAVQITVGGIAPLSVSTGLQVTKSVYSVFMMLLNFFQ